MSSAQAMERGLSGASTHDVGLDGRRTVALRQLGAVGVDEQRQVRKRWPLPAEGVVQLQVLVDGREPLLRGARESERAGAQVSDNCARGDAAGFERQEGSEDDGPHHGGRA